MLRIVPNDAVSDTTGGAMKYHSWQTNNKYGIHEINTTACKHKTSTIGEERYLKVP